mgnify:CR=1 FL=1
MDTDQKGFSPSEIAELSTYVSTTASKVAAEIENIIKNEQV